MFKYWISQPCFVFPSLHLVYHAMSTAVSQSDYSQSLNFLHIVLGLFHMFFPVFFLPALSIYLPVFPILLLPSTLVIKPRQTFTNFSL